MKKATPQYLPPGWTEKKVRSLIEYYDNQTDEEGAAEIEAALEAPGETWMSVPTQLVPAIVRLIEQHEKRMSNGRSQSRRTSKAPAKKAPRPEL